MICPFRIHTLFDYQRVEAEEEKSEGETIVKYSYLENAERQEFASCVERECPFYESWGQRCRKVEAMTEED